MASAQDPSGWYTSSGSLPSAPAVQDAVDEAWRLFRDHREGSPSSVCPALTMVEPLAPWQRR